MNYLTIDNKDILIGLMAVIIVFTVVFAIAEAQGVPQNRLTVDSLNDKLTFAQKHIEDGNYTYAAVEISRHLETDSSLLSQAATLLGGNYSLVRITDNLLADRVGGFSPSGNLLIFSRDTSAIHLDDGFFHDYKQVTTGIVIYDIESNTESYPKIEFENPYKPFFRDEHSFYFLTKLSESEPRGVSKILYLHDMEPGATSKCCELSGASYYPYEDNIIAFNWNEGKLFNLDWQNGKEKVIFDNESLLSFKRPLPLIQNISVGEGVIMFESGFQMGKNLKNIYSVPIEGGTPRIMTSGQKEFMSEGSFYPAAVNAEEFVYLVGDNIDSDLYYTKDGQSYRLTFDGGVKCYPAISADGTKIAYSYMIEQDGIESYEIFMLDFSRDAALEDINYRINSLE